MERQPDMEIDPDAEQKPAEPPPLPPPDPSGWGIGGKDEEGTFAPKGKTGKLKEQEEADKADEPEQIGPIDLGPPGYLGLDTVFGFGSTVVVGGPDPRSAVNTDGTDVFIVALVADFRYRVSDNWRLGARLPFSTGSAKVPSDNDYDGRALGAFEMSATVLSRVSPRTGMEIGLAMTLPTAGGDLFASPDDRQPIATAITNQTGYSTRGYRDTPLFAPKRLSFSPSFLLSWDKRASHLKGFTKIDLMIKSGGNAPDLYNNLSPDTTDNVEIKDPAVFWLLGGSYHHDFLDGKVSAGSDAWVVWTPSRPVELVEDGRSRLQPVIEPGVRAKLGTIGGSLSYVLPLGGHLGGADSVADAANVSGLRVQVAYLF